MAKLKDKLTFEQSVQSLNRAAKALAGQGQDSGPDIYWRDLEQYMGLCLRGAHFYVKNKKLIWDV